MTNTKIYLLAGGAAFALAAGAMFGVDGALELLKGISELGLGSGVAL